MSDQVRLKPNEVRGYREKQLKAQGYRCALCGLRCTKKEATLDHDHATGLVRMVLHRSCNQTEGRVLSWIRRSRSNDPLAFLKELVLYWEKDYTGNVTHPNHRDVSQKEILRLKRRMKRLKTDKARFRYRDRIREIKKRL